MSEWVKIDDRLPKSETNKNGGDIGCLIWWKEKPECGFQIGVSNREYVRAHPEWLLYWMPLPDNPTSKK